MYTGTCLEAKYSKNVGQWSKKTIFEKIIWCTYGCSCLCRNKIKYCWGKDVWICSLMVVSLDSLERGKVCKTYLVSCDLYFRIYISRNLCRFIFENQSEFGEFLGIAKFCCTAQLGAAKQQKIARSSTKSVSVSWFL